MVKHLHSICISVLCVHVVAMAMDSMPVSCTDQLHVYILSIIYAATGSAFSPLSSQSEDNWELYQNTASVNSIPVKRVAKSQSTQQADYVNEDERGLVYICAGMYM